MKKQLQKLGNWVIKKLTLLKPGTNAIKGAAIGLLFFTAFFFVFDSVYLAADIRDPWILVLALAFLIMCVAGAFLLDLVIKKTNEIPRFYRLALLICIPLLAITFMPEPILVAFIILVVSLLGAAFYVLKKTGYGNLSNPKKVVWIIGILIGLSGLVAGIYFYFQKGLAMEPFENAAQLNADRIPQIMGDSPATKGNYKVKTMTYGSGKDKHRPEYGEKVTYKTHSVDGTAFLDEWTGLSGKWRTHYWGFDSKALPINARVWYPEGKGPFPLVLVVHGNHSMTDFSDPGYDYLGEMLASRGMILASVDENFFNGNWSDIFGGLKKENDARGWLLLEHLKIWHQWNAKPGHAFYGKIDTGRIALIGHSRGGEAVAHAALLNSLEYYPDDAAVKLNYHFNIRGIVAIAPVDGQYQPGETPTRLKDIDYLTLHGSQDGDVTSFMGSMQFERIRFTSNTYHFKAGVYVYGANHGQFNTSWGDNDAGFTFKGLFNLAQLMPAKKQQEIAKVYISAFLETSLLGKRDYLPLFTDARYGRKWLPETVYLNQFEDANTRYVANFDEDFDVTTGTLDSVTLSSKNLTIWREQEIVLKDSKKGSRAVFLGWHYKTDKGDSVEKTPVRNWVAEQKIATYTIQIQPSILKPDTASALVFSLAESQEESDPRSKGKWVDEDKKKKDTGKGKGKEEKKKEKEKDKEDEKEKSLDLTIELVDRAGQKVSFPLSRFSALQRELEVRIWKLDFLKDKKESEKIFQKYCIPFTLFREINPAFSPEKLSGIRFVFDRYKNGVIVLDQVGFMKLFGRF